MWLLNCPTLPRNLQWPLLRFFLRMCFQKIFVLTPQRATGNSNGEGERGWWSWESRQPNIWKQSIHFRVQLYSWHVKTIQNSNTLWRANINLAAIKKLLSTIKCLVCGGPHAAVCNTCDFCFLHVSEVRTKVSLISDGLRLLPLGGRTSSLRPSDSWAKTEVGQKI